MKHRLFSAAITLSLAFCVATAALWIRSITTCDVIASGQPQDAGRSLSTHPGGLEFTATSGLSGLWFGILTPGWQRSSFTWGTPRLSFSITAGRMMLGLGMSQWTQPPRYFLGFGFESTTLRIPPPAPMAGTRSLTRIVVPFWFLILFPATPPLLRLLRWRRRRLRHRRQICQHCGYDLRATPDRCPECGLERKSEKPSIAT